MIIDPGAEAGRILEEVQDSGLSIKIIVVTHMHADHIGALGKVKEATKAPFAVHEAEASKGYRIIVDRFPSSIEARVSKTRLVELDKLKK